VRAARKRLPRHVELMVDFNQALSSRGPGARPSDRLEGIAWIEEPIRHDDFEDAPSSPASSGRRTDRREFFAAEQIAEALAAGACDFVMPTFGDAVAGSRLATRRKPRADARRADVPIFFRRRAHTCSR